MLDRLIMRDRIRVESYSLKSRSRIVDRHNPELIELQRKMGTKNKTFFNEKICLQHLDNDVEI